MEITKKILHLLLTKHYSNIGFKVFIQKSKSDCRPLERAIDTFEEMDVPVTADEVIQTLKKILKDSAPGLEGMKKCDLNKIDSRRHGHPCDTGIVTCIPKNKERSIPAISG